MSMEGFTAAQISDAMASCLDFNLKGRMFNSGIQDKPTLAKFENTKKPFTGGREYISLPVKFETGAGGVNDKVTGYSHEDTVGFYNPGNGLRANFVWREHHLGMTISETQLKRDNIKVDDGARRPSQSNAARLAHVLAPVMEEATADFLEQYDKTMNDLIWGDGTADTSALAGLRSIIHDIPTLGTVGGLSAVTYSKWRNFAFTAAFNGDASFDANHGGDKITAAAANGGALLTQLQNLWRQLRRYGGRPDCFAAGSDFIEAMEMEIRANGNYSDTGFTKKQDGSMGEMYFKGVAVYYDPTLDDLSRSKYAYIWDSRDIHLRYLEGDWRRQRNPARPYDKFVFHQSVVATGQMVTRRRNSAAVVEIN